MERLSVSKIPGTKEQVAELLLISMGLPEGVNL